MPPSDAAVRAAILGLIARRAPASSVCPSEVARQLAADEPAWRALMPRVRDQAAVLAAQQRVRITRRGEPVDPADLHRGAIRLARGPAFDGPAPPHLRSE
jgi:hypothetical protein